MKILGALAHAVRLAHSKAREIHKRATRSPKWAKVERNFLALHPECAACGSRKHLQVHHILPFAVHPELELDVNNLITLCMDIHEDHLRIGHAGNFREANPLVREHAEWLRKHPGDRALYQGKAKTAVRLHLVPGEGRGEAGNKPGREAK